MKAIALIPARSNDRDFHDKHTYQVGNKSVIRWTYESVKASGLFADIIVVSDDDTIIAEAKKSGAKTFKTGSRHESHIHFAAEAAKNTDADAVVVIQGNLPLIRKDDLSDLLYIVSVNDEHKADVASCTQMIHPIHERWAYEDTNIVKAAVDMAGFAMFFMRYVKPFNVREDIYVPVFEHKAGAYAFRKKALTDFLSWPESGLESLEKIECLRLLEHGLRVRTTRVDFSGIEVNSFDDITKVEDELRRREWSKESAQ